MTTYAACPRCRTEVRSEPSGERVRLTLGESAEPSLAGQTAVACYTCGTRDAIEPWLAAWRAAGSPYLDDPLSA